MNEVKLKLSNIDTLLFKSLKESSFFSMRDTFKMFGKQSEAFNIITLDDERYILVCENISKTTNYILYHDNFKSIIGSKITNIEQYDKCIQATFEYTVIVSDIIFNTEQGVVKISWNIKKMEIEKDNGIRLYKIL